LSAFARVQGVVYGLFGVVYLTALVTLTVALRVPSIPSSARMLPHANTAIKSIGIVGGGFAGLGCGYYASQIAKEVVVYDASPGPGCGGASSIAVSKHSTTS
jgi:hypothetical protein